MAALFISHSSHDRALVTRLRDWLAAEGYGALFVDFDPELGIPAGRNWERELYAQLRRADCVLLVLTAAAAASRWCFAEVSLARSLGRTVIALRVDPDVRMGLVSDVQGVRFTGDAPSFAELRGRLERAGFAADHSFAWSADRGPYPGLAPFAAEDAAVFFGRTAEIDELLTMLQPTLQRGAGQFVAIVGPSGSGKSSLLRAGVVPRLLRRPDWLVLPVLLPGRQPANNLARCLWHAFHMAGGARRLTDVAAAVAGGPEGVVDLLHELAGAAGERRLLLPIDQAEELVTRAGRDEQHAFLRLLREVLCEEPELWVLATLRSEFLSADIERAGIAQIIDKTLVVEPLAQHQLPEVILGPAQRAGIDFAPGLVERMVLETADDGGGDALPLLQVTLQALYQGVGSDALITAEAYERTGGVRGALRQRADRVRDEVAARGLGGAVVPLLLRLVSIEGHGEPTGRRVRRRSLPADEQAVADAFVDARLLTATGGDDDPPTIAVAHEALLRSWPAAADAIEASRTTLQLRSDLDRLAADWEAAERDDAYLLRGVRLATFSELLRERPGDLDALQRDYVAASRAHATAELEAARRSNRRLRMLAGGLSVAVALMALAGGVAVLRTREAQRQARLTAAALLSARADAVVDNQPDLAIALGLESMRLVGQHDAQPPAGLVTGLARMTHATRVVGRGGDQVHAVAYSPDGAVLAFAGWDLTVRLVNPDDGAPVGRPMTGHTDVIMAMAYSPDGTRIASAGSDRTVRLWDPRTQRQLGAPLVGHTAQVTALAFTADGSVLASADSAGTVRLWDPADGVPIGAPARFGPETWALAFGPDRTLLAVGRQGGVHLWEPGTPPDDSEIIRHPGLVRAVAFNRDGSELAVGGSEVVEGSPTHTRVWRIPERTERRPQLEALPTDVRGVAYSPVADLLASTGEGGVVQLADTAAMDVRPQLLAGHNNLVRSVAFSPDGRWLATGSWDTTVRVFATTPTPTVRLPLSDQSRAVSAIAMAADGTLVSADDTGAVVVHNPRGVQTGPPLAAHHNPIGAVAVTRDGALAGSGATDGTAAVWDLRRRTARAIPTGLTAVGAVAFDPAGQRAAFGGEIGAAIVDLRRPGAPVVDVDGHVEPVTSLAFSADGTTLATAGEDQRVILHDLGTGGGRRMFRDHGGVVRAVAFSPDGRMVASAGDDGAVVVRPLASDRRPLRINASGGAVHAVAISADGQRLVAGGVDGTARVWSTATGRQLGYALSGHAEPITAVAFTPDGDVITAGDGLWRWDTAFDRWAAAGCAVANRNLTRAEWRAYLPDRPYARTCP